MLPKCGYSEEISRKELGTTKASVQREFRSARRDVTDDIRSLVGGITSDDVDALKKPRPIAERSNWVQRHHGAVSNSAKRRAERIVDGGLPQGGGGAEDGVDRAGAGTWEVSRRAVERCEELGAQLKRLVLEHEVGQERYVVGPEGEGAALEDGAAEESRRGGQEELRGDRPAAGGKAEERDPRRVTAERKNIRLHPAKGELLVQKAEVGGAGNARVQKSAGFGSQRCTIMRQRAAMAASRESISWSLALKQL